MRKRVSAYVFLLCSSSSLQDCSTYISAKSLIPRRNRRLSSAYLVQGLFEFYRKSKQEYWVVIQLSSPVSILHRLPNTRNLSLLLSRLAIAIKTPVELLDHRRMWAVVMNRFQRLRYCSSGVVAANGSVQKRKGGLHTTSRQTLINSPPALSHPNAVRASWAFNNSMPDLRDYFSG